MKTTDAITVKRSLSDAQISALQMLGFSAEIRGGDATRSTFRNSNVRRTGVVIRIVNTDGSALTDEARKTVAAILA